MRRGFFTILAFLSVLFVSASGQSRWRIGEDGAIHWQANGTLPHFDHIEMSGQSVSAVLRYGITEDEAFIMERSMVFPMLRTVPNNTHASLMQRVAMDIPRLVTVGSIPLSREKCTEISIDGALAVRSVFSVGRENIGNTRQSYKPVVELSRIVFPSVDKPMLCEIYTIRNISDRAITVNVPHTESSYVTPAERGVDGSYAVDLKIIGSGSRVIAPDAESQFFVTVQGRVSTDGPLDADVMQEYAARMDFVSSMDDCLILTTPDSVINTAFRYAKIRAAESIFKTKGGYLHSPGGESYYAAIWANDQAEYVNPLFPFMGYHIATESALNSFRHFARFMNDEYKPIPSSIIAEGTDIWNGAGDRGDAAMIAYGAGRFVLASGDRNMARELWPLIEWCLEYCRRNLNENGVVASRTDELEGRFPAGKANLCTSSLYYDALISASYICRILGEKTDYAVRARKLRADIESYFGADMGGYRTYRYYDGNEVLRAWIAIPLTMGIDERAVETTAALLSDRLWSENGIVTAEGDKTYWDRATLYAFRGIMATGGVDKVLDYLNDYSVKRLLGEHVPYPVEAYPEGGGRHLSAESGLYLRIFTEGLFAIRPIGLDSFSMIAQIPDGWNRMSLNRIKAFGRDFGIEVSRAGEKLRVEVYGSDTGTRYYRGSVVPGSRIDIKLK